MAFTIESSAFNNGDEISIQYTCDGKNISPPLIWKEAPLETKSYVLIMDDLDTFAGTWVHWIIFNIPGNFSNLPENIQTLPPEIKIGKNSWGIDAYRGPCPSTGQIHHYSFKLYALSSTLSLETGVDKNTLENAMKPHILATARLMVNYSRHPLKKLNYWLTEEKNNGIPNPQHAVLSSCSENSTEPQGRVVAIRKIELNKGLLFFTQSGTKKVKELKSGKANLTFWFSKTQRSVSMNCNALELNPEENEFYWGSYPREAQLRFLSYAPTSSQPIADKQILEERKKKLTQDYEGKIIPMPQEYKGYWLTPKKIVFYAYRTDELSDVQEWALDLEGQWGCQLLSP